MSKPGLGRKLSEQALGRLDLVDPVVLQRPEVLGGVAGDEVAAGADQQAVRRDRPLPRRLLAMAPGDDAEQERPLQRERDGLGDLGVGA